MQNVLTFDLEHWYTATLVRSAVSNPTDHLRESVNRVRSLLAAHDTTATFFVVGDVAEQYPDLLAALAADGHDLASHGQTHTPVFDLDRASFREELIDSRDAIETATGQSVAGFRAPNFSITHETAWAFDVLSEVGYAYDSSVFPVKTPMYGVSGAPLAPYRIDPQTPFSVSAAAASSGLIEAPVAVHPRFRVPVAGGFYARVFPTRVLEWGIRALNDRGYPAVLYFHPWEFNPAVRSAEPPLHARAVSYVGIDRLEAKLARLLERFEFDSMTPLLDGFAE